MARRWNGNYQHVSTRLEDVPKSKTMRLKVMATFPNTTTTTNDDGYYHCTKTLQKKRMESLQHVLTKAVIWKLFRKDYDRMEIELDIGDPNYLPDVVGWKKKKDHDKDNGPPQFWGESGRMKPHKALDLMKRYPDAHIVHCRWGMASIDTFAEPMLTYMSTELEEGRLDPPSTWWKGKFTFASLPLDVWRFFDNETGEILVTMEDLEWRDLDVSTIVVARDGKHPRKRSCYCTHSKHS